MREHDPGGMAALLVRLERLAERPDDGTCATIVREAVRALPLLSLTPLGNFRDGLGRVRDRLRRERRPDSFGMDGMLAALEILCEEHDAAIAHLLCRRCGSHRLTFHVVMRTLRNGEERVCEGCKDKRLDQGWSLLAAAEPMYAWCYSCQRHMKPMHCVGPNPDPMVLTVCDRCTDDLRSAGWRPAVTTTYSL